MSEPSSVRNRLERQSNVAFIVVVLAAYASLPGDVSRYAGWPLILIGLGIYIILQRRGTGDGGK